MTIRAAPLRDSRRLPSKTPPNDTASMTVRCRRTQCVAMDKANIARFHFRPSIYNRANETRPTYAFGGMDGTGNARINALFADSFRTIPKELTIWESCEVLRVPISTRSNGTSARIKPSARRGDAGRSDHVRRWPCGVPRNHSPCCAPIHKAHIGAARPIRP